MPQASLAFVLHAHLPFVRHPAHEDFLEERWLAEAITETYIPLLEMLGAPERHRVPARLTPPPRPPLLAELARVGVRYFFVDTHGIAHATPRPVYGVYAPIACDSGVAAFGRDPDSSKQVWSAEEGYPGDFWYRDFYRDIGFDLDYDYVRPYLPPTGQRILTGLKYHRITGKTDVKAPYEPERARERLEAHAAHFVAGRVHQAAWLARAMDRPPIIVCPYDAELFGHWWFEGPWWLEAVLRRLAVTPELRAGTPGDDLARHPTVQRATPAASTWGWKGYNEVWLAGENDWLYRHLHATADRLHALCRSYPSADERTRRALTQALRELFLAQASDWAFMMSRATTVEYAVRRSLEHLLRCQELCAQVERGAVDDLRLAALEDTDNLFPTLDYRVFV